MIGVPVARAFAKAASGFSSALTHLNNAQRFVNAYFQTTIKWIERFSKEKGKRGGANAHHHSTSPTGCFSVSFDAYKSTTYVMVSGGEVSFSIPLGVTINVVEDLDGGLRNHAAGKDALGLVATTS